MLRRLLILNAVLIIGLVLGGMRLRRQWNEFTATHRIENIQASPESISTLPPAAASPATSVADWAEILGRNPFSFDRNDVPIIASSATDQVGPKPVLFGTMSLGKEVVALMGPGTPGNRNTRPLRVGESLDGWEVVEIQSKSVAVRAGERNERIIMNDPTAQIPRDYTRTQVANTAPLVQSTQQQQQSQQPQTNNNSRSAASATPDISARPAPLDANGTPKKGHWMKTPFGDAFVEER